MHKIIAVVCLLLVAIFAFNYAEAATLKKPDPHANCTRLARISKEIAVSVDLAKSEDEVKEIYTQFQMKYPNEQYLDSLFVFVLRPPHYEPEEVETAVRAACIEHVKAGTMDA